MGARLGSILIESVSPQLDGGESAIKRVVGEPLEVSADIFKEGHDILRAAVRVRQIAPPNSATDWEEVPMAPLGNDAWQATVPLTRMGRYSFTIQAWVDRVASWASELERKVAAKQDVRSELLEGAELLSGTAERARHRAPSDARWLAEVAKELSERSPTAVERALDIGLLEIAARHADRSSGATLPKELHVVVERPRAQLGAWYEFFPRSAPPATESRPGTFKDCERLLPSIAEMGFDIIYLPPIHPIGRTGRKGKNNTLRAEPSDVGSPWAIGATEGGHKAVHPQLGTLDDFKKFNRAAAAVGLEVALDLAFQCSPDHPYLKEHPEWFQRRPDGTIKTAENPPKRYEDIVNFNFWGPHQEALWRELLSVVLHWVEVGVRIFRVDNPHTKPIHFWRWLIRQVTDTYPDVVFLSEAFTRPKIMKALAKAGFGQSYTYFTWRNFKHELEEYLKELTQPPVADYMRGNLWPNTPDILPEFLQRGGPAAFKIRLALAATLSSSYGIYCGYEWCEANALPGKEEYLDSEKYQIGAWHPDKPDNIRGFIASINRIRKENPALQLYRNLRFYKADNDQVLFYGKSSPDKASQILMAASLDPFSPQSSILHVPLEQLGIGHDEIYQVHELLEGGRALWKGPTARVDLSPDRPVAIWRVLRFKKSEQGFDYYH
jgi:starch synthase (maltosyl-transferring)